MRELFAKLGALSEGKPVTDMASTKADVVEWAAAEGIDLVGGHPMCGKETSGIDAADPSMFEHAPWVLTRDEPRITELVEAVGAELSRLRRHLEADDPRLIELFEEARSVRERWARK